MIKILQKFITLVSVEKTCGDAGCCSWDEWEEWTVEPNEEFSDDMIRLEGLEEGVDYIRIED